jgi:hypothetical protein
MPICIAIDPGPEESAWIFWDGKKILRAENLTNDVMVDWLAHPVPPHYGEELVCAIEQIRGFGVMASDKLFDTCCWTGRFLQAFGADRTFWVPRKKAAAHICGVGGISKDSFVREAIIARFGGKEATKKGGELHGISKHLWPALAVALTFWDTTKGRPPVDPGKAEW